MKPQAPARLNFARIENLTGNAASDDFKFGNSSSGFGMINGGGGEGTDRLDYSTTITAVSVNLTLGIATKMSGFQGIESLIGGTGETTSDTLIGPNTANAWNLTGGKTGNVNDEFEFSGVENLTGGTNTDVFNFTDGADSFGTINGGSGAGIVDTLDYALVTGPIVVAMPNLSSKLTTFTGIESLIGSSIGQDILIGANATNSWSITGSDRGNYRLHQLLVI